MKKILLILIVLSIPLHYSCKEIQVEYADSGKTIHLVVDQILKVKLPGDASANSDWREGKEGFY